MQGLKIRYHGKDRWIGTYERRDDAILANTIARQWLDTTRDSKLTDKEIELCVKLAKDAAAREDRNDGTGAPPVTRAEPKRLAATDHSTGVVKLNRAGGDKWVRLHRMHMTP